MNRLLSLNKSSRGYILLPVVLLLGLLALVAFFLGHEGGIGRYLTLQRAEPEQALYVAEAGLQYATWQVQQANCINYTDIPATPFGNGSFTAVIAPHNGSPVDITATGTLAGGTSRSLIRNVQALETPVTMVMQPDGTAMQDTYIYEWKPTWNYGVSTEIGLYTYFSDDSKERGLLKFDLSSLAPGVRVLSATLELYVKNPSYNGGPVGVHRVTTAWDEGTGSGGTAPGATWDESAAGVPWTTPGGDFAPDPVIVTDVAPNTVGWNGWDITSLVSDWANGVVPNHGLMLKLQVEDHQVYFHSSDYNADPTLRPKLTITYACECGSSGTSEVVTLQPGSSGEDTHILVEKPDENRGNHIDLITDSETAAKGPVHSLLRFNLSSIPSMVNIQSAELALYLYSNSGDPDVVEAHSLQRDWVEGVGIKDDGANWITSDGSLNWTNPGGDYDSGIAGSFVAIGTGWKTLDLTTLVQGWINGSLPNYGIALLSPPASGNNEKIYHSSDSSDPALHPKLTISYTCPCGFDCSPVILPEVLFVVNDAAPLASKDDGRKTLMESWGFTVTLIEDIAGQAEFDTAAASVDVVYVSSTVNESVLGDKLTGSPTGIVNESPGMLDNFGFCSDTSLSFSADTFTNTDPAHFITEPFSGNPVTVFTSGWSMAAPSGTLAPDLQNVGEVSGQLTLVAMDTGATGWDTNPAAGRRVHLPYSSVETGDLTGDGETVLQRALLWAGGEGAGSGSSVSPTVTLPAIADTWIYINNPDTNYGSDPLMQAGANAAWELMHSLVEFDLSTIPAGATVQTATLRLYADGKTGNQPKPIGLYRVTADWDENSVTWNSAGGGTYDPAPLAMPTIDWSVGWKEWDVPPGLIHEWIDGVSPNFGLLLYYQGSKKNFFLKFATKEHGDPTLHPQLVIEYTEP